MYLPTVIVYLCECRSVSVCVCVCVRERCIVVLVFRI